MRKEFKFKAATTRKGRSAALIIICAQKEWHGMGDFCREPCGKLWWGQAAKQLIFYQDILNTLAIK